MAHFNESDSMPDGDGDRRGFLVRSAAVVVGGIVTLFPFAAGLFTFADPLRRKSNLGGFLRVATLDEIPADGLPRQFTVRANRSDAWNHFPNEPIGAVYLRRTAEDELTAFNVVCPHAGCFVDFDKGRDVFQCPCHDSSFEPDGRRIDPHRCPSPRDLDTLEIDVRAEGDRREVWVRFQNFRAGVPDKIAQA